MNKHYMLCVNNQGYEASFEVRKIYEVLTDRKAKNHNQLRIIDESGEDYLYPINYFAPLRFPSATKEKLELIMS